MTTITPTTRKYEWQAALREAQAAADAAAAEAERKKEERRSKQEREALTAMNNHLQLVLWKLGIPADPDNIRDGAIDMPGGIQFYLKSPLNTPNDDAAIPKIRGSLFVGKIDLDSNRVIAHQQVRITTSKSFGDDWIEIFGDDRIGIEGNWSDIATSVARAIDKAETDALDILHREAEQAAREAEQAAMAPSEPAPEPEDLPEPEPPPSPIIIVWANVHGLNGIREAEEEVAHHIENGYSLMHTHIDGEVVREEDTNSRAAYFILTRSPYYGC